MHNRHKQSKNSSKESSVNTFKPKNKYLIIWRKVWNFLWNSDSIWSWIVNIALAFVLIKFVVYPLLGLLFATSFPIVAVVSGSMEHGYAPATDSRGYPVEQNGQILYSYCNDTKFVKKSFLNMKQYGGFDEFWNLCGRWYETRNISYSEFMNFPYTNGFNKGDIMVLYGAKMKDVKVGDIVVFKSTIRTDPIIHRVVDIRIDNSGEYHLTTKGDHNRDSLSAEMDITKDMYIAKAIFDIPYLGWIKIWFTYVITGFQPIH